MCDNKWLNNIPKKHYGEGHEKTGRKENGGGGERERQLDNFCVAHDYGLRAMGNCALRARFREQCCTVQMDVLTTLIKTST